MNLVDTGINTMTGGRLLRLKDLKDDTFLMTYGDGVSNINLKNLLIFIKNQKKIITLTAVRPQLDSERLRLKIILFINLEKNQN